MVLRGLKVLRPWGLALALVVVGVACQGTGDGGGESKPLPEAKAVPGERSIEAKAPQPLGLAPPRSLSGEPLERLELQGLREVVKGLEGKPLVLHLWAGWGGPEKELRALSFLSGELEGRVHFLGVCGELLNRPDVPRTLDSLRGLLTQNGVTYPMVLYTGGEDELGEWAGLTDGLPSTLILGPDGSLWARYLRPVKAGDIQDTLRVYGALPEEAP